MSDKGSVSSQQGAGSPQGVAGRLGRVAMAVALGVVVLYFVFVVLQWRGTGATDVNWARRQELLTGLQALAFTALGAILGTTAQRQVTRQVEHRAEQAEESAQRNARDAEKGRGLQATIEARSAMAADHDRDVARGSANASSSQDFLAELVELGRLYDESG